TGMEEEVDPWVGLPLDDRRDVDPSALPGRVEDPFSPLVLTLLTDTILVDPWGRYAGSLDVPGLLQEEFAGVLSGAGVVCKPLKLKVCACYCRSRMLDSFNNYLGLPRFREVALVAGSTARIIIEGGIEKMDVLRALKTIEEKGLGLRRDEGFGRVAFNHPLYPEFVRSRNIQMLSVPEQILKASDNSGMNQEGQFCRELAMFLNRYQDRAAKCFKSSEWLSIARIIYAHSGGGAGGWIGSGRPSHARWPVAAPCLAAIAAALAGRLWALSRAKAAPAVLRRRVRARRMGCRPERARTGGPPAQ
ncbi:MAG: hypothetical protein K6T75_11850, partial [Acetobacteraceae bacterium]|nr:hypothetical protein [Acetobacteraceae bacterium]